MTVTRHSSAVPKTYRRYAYIWLLLTLVLGALTALAWIFAKTPASASIANAPLTANVTSPSDVFRPSKIEALNELDTDVQPIDFDTMVRDLRDYPAEFKDKRYLLANKGKWTVQVMNVAENDVIVDYLSGRDDRAKFAYFRYRDENDQPRYMLTYGVLSSPQEAIGASQLIDFGLPSNVQVIPEEINRYVSIIDNYELADPVVDLSSKSNRKVKLQPTRREVPVRAKSPTTNNSNSSNNASTNAQVKNNERNSTSNDQLKNNDDKNNDTKNSDAKRTNEAPAKSIQGSEDTDKTLAVKEEKVVITPGSDNKPEDSNVSNKASTKKTNEAAKEKASAPKANNKPASTDNASADKKSADKKSAGDDALKSLIEEQSGDKNN